MPISLRDGGTGAAPDPVAELLALSAEFDRRSATWLRQLQAIMRRHEELERRRGSALARALHAALDPRQGGGRDAANGREVDLPGLVKAHERALIEWALAAAHGCQKDAAALLGVGATTLHEKLKRLGLLDPQGHRPVPPGTRAFNSSNHSG